MILVTGGTGFIGTVLIKQLLSAGHVVRAIKRKHSVIPITLTDQPRLTWVHADMCDFFSLKDAFKGVKKIYHCAALVSFEPKDRKDLMKVNVEGTSHIVNLCLENKIRLMFLSSVAALGDTGNNGVISENTQWEWNKNKSGYSISKYESEREVWRGVAEGLDAVIVNPPIVIGSPVDNPKSRELFELIAKGVRFYPPGNLGVVDVEDVAKVMIELMERIDISGENFIISAYNMSYKELFRKYSDILGIDAPHIPAKKWMLSVAWHTQRILNAIGFSKSGLSKEIVRAAVKKHSYTNKKVTKTLGFSFTPLTQSLMKIDSTS